MKFTGYVLFGLILMLVAFFLTNHTSSSENNKQPLIYLRSKNLYDFKMNGNQQPKIKQILTDMYVPKNCTKSNPCPAMIFIHGSVGWQEHHNKYIDIFDKNDIIVLKLHPFSSRGIELTKGNQTTVTHQMMISDAYAGLDYLSNLPYVNISRVGIAGTSLGGGAALYAAWNPPLMETIFGTKYRFAFHGAIYPPCFMYPESHIWTNGSISIFVGTEDRWTPADACIKLIANIYSNGSYEKKNKKLFLYEGEHHSYEHMEPLKLIPGAYDFGNCEFHMDDEGRTYYLDGSDKIHMYDANQRYLAFSLCAGKTDHYSGYNSKRISDHTLEDFEIELLSALKPESLY